MGKIFFFNQKSFNPPKSDHNLLGNLMEKSISGPPAPTSNCTSLSNLEPTKTDPGTEDTQLPISDINKNYTSQGTIDSLTSKDIESQYNSHYSLHLERQRSQEMKLTEDYVILTKLGIKTIGRNFFPLT